MEHSPQLGMNELDIDEENEYYKDMACLEADRNWWQSLDGDCNYGS